jgi:hypothetical protein
LAGGIARGGITRRELIGGAAALAAGAGLLGFESGGAGARPACVWGITTTDVATPTATLERLIGRRYAGFRMNGALDHPVPTGKEREEYDAGLRFVYRDLDATHLVRGRKQAVRWAAIAAGDYDDVWRAAARAITADRRWSRSNPYNLSFHHEQVVDQPWQPGGPSCGTPADYRAAFGRVHRVLAGEGALASQGGKIRLCFVPHFSQFLGEQPGWSARELDPGPDVYDLLGVDVYNRRQPSGLRLGRDAAEVIGPVHEYALRAGKRFIVPELQCGDGASAQSHEDKAAWITSFCRLTKSYGEAGPGSCAALIWTNSRRSRAGDWSVDSSPEALAAHKSWALDAFFEKRV